MMRDTVEDLGADLHKLQEPFMRFGDGPLPVLLVGVLVAGCDTDSPTEAGIAPSAVPSMTVFASEAKCTLAVHAILREANSVATVGQVQFRIGPPKPGSPDASVQYRGIYGPTGGLDFSAVSVRLVSRVPDQGPTWMDVDKSDPGTPSMSIVEFGRTVSMGQEMALALVDDASRFKAVVNVMATTGGREAEGLVAPRTSVPEPLRGRQRTCFEGG